MKAGPVAALTTATVAGFFGLLTLASVTVAAPVVAVIVGTLFVGASMAYFVDLGDKALAGTLGETDTATWLAKKFRDTAENLSHVSKDFRYERYSVAEVLPIGR